MDVFPASNYPLPSQSSLQLQYVGKQLNDVPTPAAVLDRSIIKRNCDAMLEVCKALDVLFRVHVKSHKTIELAKLQVGSSGPAHFVVSTITEAEHLLPFLLECQAQGRECSLLYGVPIPQSAVPRLFRLAKVLKPSIINILIDNLDAFLQFREQYGVDDVFDIGVYIKIDTGYHRAGIQTSSPKFTELVKAVTSVAEVEFKGFYSHFGHSYAGSSEDEAVNGLLEELNELEKATEAIPVDFDGDVVLTVGATPTATAAQNLISSASPEVNEFRTLMERLGKKFKIELHAGVYPLLDLQQVATHARPATGQSQAGFEPLSTSNIGLKMLVEVTSIYDERAKPEALISAGSLALGREPCKSYPGWGVVTGGLGNSECKVYDDQGDRTGWIVGRISQEHGILVWEGSRDQFKPLKIGEKLLLWPNHACVAGAGAGWYLIVDSNQDANRIVDVWVRWRGW
ncbi:hypothetical protein K469DRAFT_610035 [Zopfia rhizophila CBS 207.26]|uniref:D-serine dehydratase n=1 Tax=Zopfia rhizophila CBS 207.26 TaxID=1314779 RepID=A0A6A6DCE5_9PEZI|nr:hypothetical protein K469DRAFT_610035 [Zopfia rhizophila CBS 207.26]